jgi:copper(I)-binding protein
MHARLWIPLLACLLLAAPAAAHHTGAKVTPEEVWVRELIPGQDVTAAFMVLKNPDHSSDALIDASCDCAASVEIHRMVHADGQMKMERIRRLEVPAQGEVVLQPGGFHLMLFGVKPGVKAGAQVHLKLRFETAGTIEVTAPVRAAQGAGGAHQNR